MQSAWFGLTEGRIWEMSDPCSRPDVDGGRGGPKRNFLQLGDQRRNMEDVGQRGKKGKGGRIDLGEEEPRVSQPELPLLMYNKLIPIGSHLRASKNSIR